MVIQVADSSAATPKDSPASYAEIESPNTIIMSVMVIELTGIEEQLASMKATLDRLLKESAEKNAQIKRQSRQIVNLTKKLEKRPI